MAPRRAKRARPIRHSLAAALLSLLPLLAFAGVLAPGLIEVDYKEDPSSLPARRGTVVFRPVRLMRPPLMVTRGAGAAYAMDFLDIEGLFDGSRYRAELGQRLAEMQSFPSATGDLIVIDDVDVVADQELFKDLLNPTFYSPQNPLWDPNIFDVIPSLFAVGNGFRFDDFPDPGFIPGKQPKAVIPEPATGLLCGLGIGLLAATGRKRQRQPITS
jgi:PEP-CTERM motif